MRLESPALGADGSIPLKYTRDGRDVSPPLRWRDVPDEARELALVFEQTTPSTQPPAPLWLVYGLPPQTRELPEDLTRTPELDEPVRARQGRNQTDMIGYEAPLGTRGRDVRYAFRLFALDAPLDLEPGATREELERAMDGHVMEEARLDAHFERPR